MNYQKTKLYDTNVRGETFWSTSVTNVKVSYLI